MNRRDILRRAASIVCGPATYSRHAADPACVADTRRWSATGLIERSARPLRSGSWMLGPSSPFLDEAKAAVCRIVGFPHIDTWEAVERPDWQKVRDTFLKASA